MNEFNLINQRKQDHINAVLQDSGVDRQQTGFDQIQLRHCALPEINFDQLDSQCELFGHTLSFPLLISSMTGGSGSQLEKINRHLAEAAADQQIALAVGSQRVMMDSAEAQSSFTIRRYAPKVPLLANIGAVQLNYGFGLDEAKRAVNCLEADALILHLNPLQELIQPEGDRNFAGLCAKIELLAQNLPVPIILKEVGCGLSGQDIQRGLDAGVRWFDLAGRGGTSWSRIEAQRAHQPGQQALGLLFQDWGYTTPQSLHNARSFQDQARFIASGGIRNGIDMVKSVIMGGYVCGVAAPFLSPALQSTDAVIQTITEFKQAFQVAQFLVGAASTTDLFLNDALLVQP
ncbi:type 2 isopentenyl-diphosphate Delta-isomerase [Thiomicrospira cyclica]|uniref:Isopentenyl-diphosphate delta-isomerase n=1 Tax=Thiomicrospira cyclica (strain DSM 14477 / JCM 11371 / ALM1) TaxID=717773 RepID=F6DA41_THICA|nr:type 2 isopentenyl-diphosphate Delta-isomerase [Thiomicrospira cyclica]AEG32172.1 Isopentenyl-diphosphate delta-isomerase [Thiomicrospira cyclica ALM1]